MSDTGPPYPAEGRWWRRFWKMLLGLFGKS